MSELYGPFLSDIENQPIAVRRKGWPWFAWLVILGLCTFIVWQSMQSNERRRQRKEDRLNDAMFRMQAQYVLGGSEVLEGMMPGQTAFQQMAGFKNGPIPQQQRYVVLAGELVGPKQALEELERIERDAVKHRVPFSEEEKKTHGILRRLYVDYLWMRWESPAVSKDDKNYLKSNLNWFGDLALAPEHIQWEEDKAAPGAGAVAAVRLANQPPTDEQARESVLAPARRTFLLLFAGVAGGAFCFGVVGFIGLVVWFVLVGIGKIRLQFQTGTTHGGVYAETFALWLLLFFGGSFSMRWLDLPISRELAGGLMMLASLVVLAWPVLRGVSWRQVRQDIGWTKGQSPSAEPAFGVMCYVMTLPLVALGAIAVLILMKVQQLFIQSGGPGNPFERTGIPAHPVVEYLAFGTWWDWVVIFWLAAIVAPIVEETMFRGVLHRQLREATSGWGRFWSVAFSSTLIGFVFAVIHPEGMVAVPVKMALAYGFTLAREWRGTLIPAMVGHGLNNAMATLLVFVLFK